MIGKHVVIDTLDNFKTKLSLIPSSAIVLIKDVGQIYAHGTYFGAQKTYSLLTKTADGFAPKGGTSASSLISNVDTEWVLTVTNGENPTWRKLPANAFSSSSYTLPSATASDLGGIKVGQVYTATFDDLVGLYYKINIDKNGLAYVHVPWINNPYTASGNGITLQDNVFSLSLNSVTKLDSAIGNKIYAVSLDKNGKLCVSVPWTDTNNIFVGATETKNGSSGMVPAPIANQHKYFLRGDGTWVKPNLSDLNDDVVNGKYLPLTGGTLSGTLTISSTDWGSQLTIHRLQKNADALIGFSNNGDGIIGYIGVGGSVSESSKLQPYFSTGTSAYPLIHSGNIGSQSVSYARSAGRLYTGQQNKVTHYPTYIGIEYFGDVIKQTGLFEADNNANGIIHVRTHGENFIHQLGFSSNGNIYSRYFSAKLPDTTTTWKRIAFTDSNVASANYASSAGNAGGLTSNITSKSETKLSFYSAFLVKGDTTDFSWCSPTGSYESGSVTGEYMGIIRINMGNGTTKYYHDLSFNMNGKSPQWRQVVGGNSQGWRKFAFEDSNVASATKLQTRRTIWGQGFDGSGNVSGSMTEVSNITMSGDIIMNNNMGVAIKNTNGTHKWVLLVSTDDRTLVGTTELDSYIRGKNVNITYGSSQTSGIYLNSSGNVGIGTTSPLHKLHVNGVIYTDSQVVSPYFMAGLGVEGLYMATSSISWHDDKYAYKTSLIAFKSNSIALQKDTSCAGTLSVAGASTFKAVNATNVQIDYGQAYNIKKVDGGNIRAIYTDTAGLHFGTSDASTVDTRITGKSIMLRYGADGAIGFTLASDGNVAIANKITAVAARFGGTNGINIGMTYNDSTTSAYDLIERRLKDSTLYLQYNHAGGVNMCNGGGTTTLGGGLSVKSTSTFTGKTTHNGGIGATSGSFSGQITSTVAEKTAPFIVASTTKVNNLNADLLDGYHISVGTSAGTNSSTIYFVT